MLLHIILGLLHPFLDLLKYRAQREGNNCSLDIISHFIRPYHFITPTHAQEYWNTESESRPVSLELHPNGMILHFTIYIQCQCYVPMKEEVCSICSKVESKTVEVGGGGWASSSVLESQLWQNHWILKFLSGNRVVDRKIDLIQVNLEKKSLFICKNEMHTYCEDMICMKKLRNSIETLYLIGNCAVIVSCMTGCVLSGSEKWIS